MTAIANHPHRVTTAIAGVRSDLGSVTGAPVWLMDATETANALAEIKCATAQLAELEARLLCHANRVQIADQTGTSSTANWQPLPPRPAASPRTGRCGPPKASTPTS